MWSGAVEHSPPAATCFHGSVTIKNTCLFVLYASHRAQVKKALICHHQTSVVMFCFIIQCFSMTFSSDRNKSVVMSVMHSGVFCSVHPSSFQLTCSRSLRLTGMLQPDPARRYSINLLLMVKEKRRNLSLSHVTWWTLTFYQDPLKYPGELDHVSSSILLTQQECVNRRA